MVSAAAKMLRVKCIAIELGIVLRAVGCVSILSFVSHILSSILGLIAWHCICYAGLLVFVSKERCVFPGIPEKLLCW